MNKSKVSTATNQPIHLKISKQHKLPKDFKNFGDIPFKERLLKWEDVSRKAEGVTIESKKEVKYLFYFVNSLGIIRINVNKGQTPKRAIQKVDSFTANQVKFLIKIRQERAACNFWLRIFQPTKWLWHKDSGELLSCPQGDNVRDFIDKLQIAHTNQ